jgi:sensor histidine kinase YesM
MRAGLLLIPLVWVLAALISSARGGMMIENGRARPMPWSEIFSGQLYDLFWWMFIGPVAILALRKTAGSQLSATVRGLIYALVGLASVLAFWLFRVFIHLPGDHFVLRFDLRSLGSTVPSSASMYLLILFGALTTFALAQARERERESTELLLHASRLETQLVEAQLGVLRAQLHPHFLFNALHAVSTLVDWRPKEARRMLVRLSELLRMAIELSEEKEITLAREIEWLERYLELQQIRFGDRLSFDLRSDPETIGALVPSLVLQPLVENALEHGIEKRMAGGNVEIIAERDGKWLRIRVRDNGPGLGTSSGSREGGVGVRNARERLRALYGDDQRLVLRNREDEGAEALVELPFHQADDEIVTVAHLSA